MESMIADIVEIGNSLIELVFTNGENLILDEESLKTKNLRLRSKVFLAIHDNRVVDCWRCH